MLHWSVAFCGSETWTLRKADQFCNLVLEKNGDQLHGSYEKEVLQRVKEERHILHAIK